MDKTTLALLAILVALGVAFLALYSWDQETEACFYGNPAQDFHAGCVG